MRVKLAIQVLSSRSAGALQLQNRSETKSTETFIRMFDQFFDCLNVNTITNGNYHRKPVLCTYTDINDLRFKWLIDEFMGFLDRWEMKGQQHNHLTVKKRKQLCLCRETLEGFRITVKNLIKIPWSKQRGIGGFCDNPTVRQFQHNTLRPQVSGASSVLAARRGNCQVFHNGQFNASTLQRRKHKRQ
ncbi:THAP9 [Mytilus coruscus]|uniref:THAP9 n=1 Tax=Mytilus coruscus TaxID=42192 RepID=A0A6J8CFP5_MYTCO|nr:THAP9 [Mytilus coruscus]